MTPALPSVAIKLKLHPRIRRSQLLRVVAGITGVPTELLSRWWWSLPHRDRGRARRALIQIAAGSRLLAVRWREERETHAVFVGGGRMLKQSIARNSTLEIAGTVLGAILPSAKAA